MTLQQTLTQLESWILTPPDSKSPFAERALRSAARILFAVVRDVINGQLTLHAMGLVYTTILSIVPLLALSFSVLKAFNVQNKFTPMLYSFFEPMGDKGIEIYNNILSFVANMKVGVLGFVGLALLIYTVISLVQKIERAFNVIWYVPQLRSFSQRFSNYLSVILVGPLLVVSAISVTATTMNSSVVQALVAIEPFGTLVISFSKLVPFLMIIGTFTFFYILMPNTKVNFGSALVGGVVGGSAWQTTSLLFTSFVVDSAKYDAIYSGFAVGILLLIWLYINWLILLMGSSIAFYHQHGNHITKSQDIVASADVTEKLGMEIMMQVARRFDEGLPPLSQNQLEQMNNVPAVLTREITDKLIHHHLLTLSGEKGNELVPARSIDLISLADVLQALRADDLDIARFVTTSPSVERALDSMMLEIKANMEQVSLRDLAKGEK